MAKKAKPGDPEPDDRRPSHDWTPARKLNKKQTEVVAEKRSNQRRSTDDFIKASIAAARQKYGTSAVMLGGETSKLAIVIPIPALPFEILIGQSGFPLSVVMQLVAEAKVGKSSLLAEFGRWFDGVDGAFTLLECESKFNDVWYRSIMGPEVFDERVAYHKCESLEGWQERLTSAVKEAQDFMDGTAKDPGPGRVIPFLYGVDSIFGKASEQSQEKILGKRQDDGRRSDKAVGYAERSYAIEAQIFAKYLRAVPDLVDRWPMALVFVNHLRNTKDDQGNAVRLKPGGAQVSFQQSYEIELQRAKGPKYMIACEQFAGYPVRITCPFNSFSQGNRAIVTRMLWWYEPHPETGRPRQVTCWDWDWSLVHTISTQLSGDRFDPIYRARLKEAGIHVEVLKTGDVENTAWSRTVGVKKENPVSWAELGAMLRSDESLKQAIRDAFCVVTRPTLSGSIDKLVEAELRKAL